MLIRGKCHCGNIAFTLDWEPAPAQIPARACTCTFCQKHGGLWTSYPAGVLRVAILDPARASAYAFGTRTAEFHVCATCGVVPLVTSRIDGTLYAVVSIHAFDGVDPSLIAPAAPATFDAESEAGRLLRRKRNWIGDVRFVPPEATGAS